MKSRQTHYEEDAETFTADYYQHARYPGVAFYVRGWETEPDEDTEWTGQEVRTGKVIAVMVGDDHKYRYDPDDLTTLERSAFCGGCGQIGCRCDGREE
jgi:hypothetical protein